MRTGARQQRDVGQENKSHATSRLATTTRGTRILRLSNTDSHCQVLRVLPVQTPSNYPHPQTVAINTPDSEVPVVLRGTFLTAKWNV
jgi:hypothetical protein